MTTLGPGAFGQPGDRTFVIQARKGQAVLSVLVEKKQVRLLAAEANQFLDRIAEEDPFTARHFMARVERSLSMIVSQPGIGTPAVRRGERRYPIPNTGHVVNYRVTRSAVRIRLWYRARQHMAPKQA